MPPKSVAIVAMGASAQMYLAVAAQRGGRHEVAENTWAINGMGGVIEHDLLFHMDDCRLQESRTGTENIQCMLKWLRRHPRFFTSKAYPEYPGAIEFPLEDVVNSVGSTYLNNTVAYAVAYAIHIGVNTLSVWGADYTYPDRHKAESGRGCVEFLLGIAAARGIAIQVPDKSSLLDADVPPEWKPYGYDAYHVRFDEAGGRTVVTKDPKELPAPDEIEKRYSGVK